MELSVDVGSAFFGLNELAEVNLSQFGTGIYIGQFGHAFNPMVYSACFRESSR